jgi:hypothetical protein
MSLAILDVEGDAHRRGRAFGRLRREAIHAYTSDWLQSLQRSGIADPRCYLSSMLRETDFLPAIRAHAPDLLAEVEGIAAGAELPFELALTSQLMDEEWAFRRIALRRAQAVDKCSSIAIVSGKGPTFIGQNMDLGEYTDGHQLLLRIGRHDAQPAAAIATIGGMIGLLGVSAAGIGVCVNSLPQLPSAREGLPVAFVVRRLLQAKSLGEAAELVHTLPHATGQHYLIADATSICSLEASPEEVVDYRAHNPDRVLHTNHPLTDIAAEAGSPLYRVNSTARLLSLRRRLLEGDVTIETMQAALSSCDDPDHPVCRVRRSSADAAAAMSLTSFTTCSMISALPREASDLQTWVSAGPPTRDGYVHLTLPATA